MNPENCVRWRFEEVLAIQTKRRWRLLAVVLGGAQYISITHLGESKNSGISLIIMHSLGWEYNGSPF